MSFFKIKVMAGQFQMAISTRLSFLEILFINLKKEMPNLPNWSLVLYSSKRTYLQFNTCKSFSYNNTSKNKAAVAFALTTNKALNQFMVMNVNIAPLHIIVIVLFMKDMVVTMLVLQINLLVLTLFVNLYILWTVIDLFFFSPV